MESCSPQITLRLINPALLGSVRKPSLPATSSRQPCAISLSIVPASSTCCGSRPNVMHLPMRCLTSESHLGFNVSVAGFVDFASSVERCLLFAYKHTARADVRRLAAGSNSRRTMGQPMPKPQHLRTKTISRLYTHGFAIVCVTEQIRALIRPYIMSSLKFRCRGINGRSSVLKLNWTASSLQLSHSRS